jgi:hypothetical protein
MPDKSGGSVPEGRVAGAAASPTGTSTDGPRERRSEGRSAPSFLLTTPAVAADEVAEMALRLRAEVAAAEAGVRCDACDAPIEGEPAGSGLFVWSRGEEEPRLEEPPLCTACATAIGLTALRTWEAEDDEEG